MDVPARRRPPAGSSGGSITKAVGIGIAIGLLISAALFAHNRQIGQLKDQLEAQLIHQERAASEERSMRELAEQLQTEADTERTSIQNKLKDKDGAIVAARAEASKAQDLIKQAQKKADDAVIAQSSLRKTNESLKKKIELMQAELQTAEEKPQAGGGGGEVHKPWIPSAERDAKDPELAALLSKVAIDNEIMVAICNKHLAYPDGALDIWSRNINRANVKNAMVVALDDETEEFCKQRNLNVIRIPPLKKPGQTDWSSNHAVSAMKFTYLQRFLSLGYSIFLTDVDILFFQDPFPYLTRDSDVEGMSDGWNNQTAYGYDDVQDNPEMGWARYAHSMRVFCMNSGLFFIRPTQASMTLLQRVVYRIDTEQGWDQALFNEVLFFPAFNDRKQVPVTKRVLDYYKFMNSKTLFNEVRYNEPLLIQRPVSLHVNFHADKLERLLAAEAWWVNGNKTDLMAMPLKS